MHQNSKKIKTQKEKKGEEKKEEKKEEKEEEQNILDAKFYSQEVVQLARDLIGKVIVRELPEGIVKCIIVETEAYKAPEDKACHAYNNKKTERTKYFWQDGGHVYMYSIYGHNYCLNIAAGSKEEPEAVLIRAVEPIEGIELVRSMRKTQTKNMVELSNGPGKVGSCLALDLTWNGFDLRKGEKMYLIEGDMKEVEVEVSTRVNIDYAEEWIEKPWRFTLKGNKFVSKVKRK